MPKLIDLIGQRFGRLVVIRRVDNNKWGSSRWLCQCDCEKETAVSGYNLKSGRTKSCGCLQKEIIRKRSIKHGRSRNDKIYRSWCNMIQRCTNPNFKYYKDYGGRGITVCKRWMKFKNFLKDMIKKWKPGLTLERRKNWKGYSPKNCYWATYTEQNRNSRHNHLITAFGKTQCIAAWSEETGVPTKIIQWRISHGWPPERALTEPARKHKKYKKRKK